MFATCFQKLGEIKHTYIIFMYVRIHMHVSVWGVYKWGGRKGGRVYISWGRKGGRDEGEIKQWGETLAIGKSEKGV